MKIYDIWNFYYNKHINIDLENNSDITGKNDFPDLRKCHKFFIY